MRAVPARQRGAAALVVTMVLFFAMLLVAAFANRGLLFEQRASANQYRAAQAFEAAEAGLDWALAQLNNAQPLGADCLPSSAAGALPLRERLLRYTPAAGHVQVTWNDAGTTTPVQPACVRGSGGWVCSCPASAHPALALAAAADGAAQPAFALQLLPGTQRGVLRLVSVGCTGLAGACRPGATSDTRPDATARVQVDIALVPALASPPSAALTLAGSLSIGTAALGLHNPDASTGGIVLHAGGAVDAPALRISGAPGASGLDAVVEGDDRLRTRSGERLFAGYFGLDKALWRGQATVRRIDCRAAAGGECAAAVAAAVARGERLLAVDGDLALDGPLQLGTPDRPVALVVAGALALRGAVELDGLAYASSITWNDASAGARVRGALVSESGYGGNAVADVFRDAAVLERLRDESGSFARVPGSWRDF